MPTLLLKPTVIPAAGEPPKIIEEFGRVNSRTSALSIARMTSAPGWREPGQTPEFDEYTVVLRGELQVHILDKHYNVAAGQAIIVHAGEWVCYSTPTGRGIHRRVLAGIFAGNGASRRVNQRAVIF